MNDIPIGRARFKCPCGYTGSLPQVNGHCTGSRNPICNRDKVTLYVSPRAQKAQRDKEEEIEQEQEELDKRAREAPAPVKSRWDTEDSDELEQEEGLDESSSPVASSGLGSSESSSTKKLTISPLDIPPTDSLHRIKLTVENLALYDTDRGEGYVGSIEAWVNEVITFHFQSCLCIELRAVQLIPIESGGS